MPHAILAAISVGAVFMGANTYIGNAPNFMVKAIAEAARVRMPTFFGYMLYSGGHPPAPVRRRHLAVLQTRPVTLTGTWPRTRRPCP